MIAGLGIDVVAIERFEQALATPGFLERIFTEGERGLGNNSLAARWAAKEALAKALGAPGGLSWQDAEVVKDPDGRPQLRVTGTVAAHAEKLGIVRFHLSLSHDAGIASAVVIAETAP